MWNLRPRLVFLAQVRDGGVIDVQTQVSVVDSRAKLWRPDFQIRYTRILIEISGVGKYGETEEDQKFNVDKATDRLNRLTSQGFVVWSYSAREVFFRFCLPRRVEAVPGAVRLNRLNWGM